MHFLFGISFLWCIGALVIWLIIIFIRTAIIAWINKHSNESEVQKQNKNPYSKSRISPDVSKKTDCEDFYPTRLCECFKRTYRLVGISSEIIESLYLSAKQGTDTGKTSENFLYLLSQNDRLYRCNKDASFEDVLFCVLSDAKLQGLGFENEKEIRSFIGNPLPETNGIKAAEYIASRLKIGHDEIDLPVRFYICVIENDTEFFVSTVAKEKSAVFISNLNLILKDCEFKAYLLKE